MKSEMQQFAKTAIDIFDSVLMAHGFKRNAKKIEEYSCRITYSCDERYLSIRANINPRDYPPYAVVILGEGSIDWPESDWNSIALWRMKDLAIGDHHGSEYRLLDPQSYNSILTQAKGELLEYDGGFLSGKLDYFYQARRQLNRDREPYKIYTQDKNGKYVMSYDQESLALKDKFST